MRILITNDDGITAPGLVVAEAMASELAGPDREIWVVAPAFEQSGVSHAISSVRPMRLERLGARRVAVEGSPADCVLAGLHDIMEGATPDLILSGVNRGHNVAQDTVYSGTIGGAMEGALHGVPSVALSQYFGPATGAAIEPFAAARAHGAAVIRQVLAHGVWQHGQHGVFYNINFPPAAPEAVLGVKATVQGHRDGATFGVQPQTAPNGRSFLWLTHGRGNAGTAPGSDSRECHDGFVTVTPLTTDLTAHGLVANLAEALG